MYLKFLELHLINFSKKIQKVMFLCAVNLFGPNKCWACSRSTKASLIDNLKGETSRWRTNYLWTFNFIGNIQTTQFLDYSYLDFVWTYYVGSFIVYNYNSHFSLPNVVHVKIVVIVYGTKVSSLLLFSFVWPNPFLKKKMNDAQR